MTSGAFGNYILRRLKFERLKEHCGHSYSCHMVILINLIYNNWLVLTYILLFLNKASLFASLLEDHYFWQIKNPDSIECLALQNCNSFIPTGNSEIPSGDIRRELNLRTVQKLPI